MSYKPLSEGNIHSAENELSPGCITMYIISMSYSEIHTFHP